VFLLQLRLTTVQEQLQAVVVVEVAVAASAFHNKAKTRHLLRLVAVVEGVSHPTQIAPVEV
jgi:hypothetical protein